MLLYVLFWEQESTSYNLSYPSDLTNQPTLMNSVCFLQEYKLMMELVFIDYFCSPKVYTNYYLTEPGKT